MSRHRGLVNGLHTFQELLKTDAAFRKQHNRHISEGLKRAYARRKSLPSATTDSVTISVSAFTSGGYVKGSSRTLRVVNAPWTCDAILDEIEALLKRLPRTPTAELGRRRQLILEVL